MLEDSEQLAFVGSKTDTSSLPSLELRQANQELLELVAVVSARHQVRQELRPHDQQRR